MALSALQVSRLKQHWVRNKVRVSKQNPNLTTDYSGQLTYDYTKPQGYGAVVCLLERGLAAQEESITRAFKVFDEIQTRPRLHYSVFLLSFGWEDGLLRHSTHPQQGCQMLVLGSGLKKFVGLPEMKYLRKHRS